MLDLKRLTMILEKAGKEASEREALKLYKAAESMLYTQGFNWSQVLRQPESAPSKPHGTESPSLDRIFLEIDRSRELLSDWEKEFIESVKGSLKKWGKLTGKQMGVVTKIRSDLVGGGPDDERPK